MSGAVDAQRERAVSRLIGRVIVSAFCVLLVVGGGMFLRSGLGLRARCVEAERAEVLNVLIDVGVAGVQRAKLKQTAAFTCRQLVWLEVDGVNAGGGDGALKALDGLSMTVAVKDKDGSAVMEGTYPTMDPGAVEGGRVVIVSARPMPVGEYDVEVEVVTPAASQSSTGKRGVRLMSKYQLCGIELMGPTVGIWGGAVGVGLGLLIAAGLWATRVRGKG